MEILSFGKQQQLGLASNLESNNENRIANSFLRHYGAIEVISVVDAENNYATGNKIYIGSIDQNGLVLIWNLKDGEVLKMLKVQANAAYSISDSYPTKLLFSYQDEKTTYIELINLETDEKFKRIEGIRLGDESISSGSYCTHMGSKSKTFKSKKKSLKFIKKLEPHFFLSNISATSYCVSNKNPKTLRICNVNNLGIEAKVDLNQQTRYLKANSSLTALAACDGYNKKK